MSVKSAKRRRPEVGVCQVSQQARVDQLLRRLDYDDDFDASELEQLLRWRGSNGESVKVTTRSMTWCLWKTPTALEALKLLLDCRGDDVGSTHEVICCAASNGRPEVVTMLLNWQPTPHRTKEMSESRSKRRRQEDSDVDAFTAAVFIGDCRTVQRCLERGVDPRMDALTDGPNWAFRMAAYKGHANMIKIFLAWSGTNDVRVNAAANDNAAIRLAAENGHADVAGLLLAWPGTNGVRVDPSAHHCIQTAAASGHADMVKAFLAWPGTDDVQVNGAIKVAAHFGRVEVVALLLDWSGTNGVRVDHADGNHEAIRQAVGQGHTEVVGLLLVAYAKAQEPPPFVVAQRDFQQLMELGIDRHLRKHQPIILAWAPLMGHITAVVAGLWKVPLELVLTWPIRSGEWPGRQIEARWDQAKALLLRFRDNGLGKDVLCKILSFLLGDDHHWLVGRY